MSKNEETVMFKWACLGVASLFAVVLLYLIVDLKRDVTRSLDSAKEAVAKANDALATVNGELPQIVGEVRKGTGTLSAVAEDVRLLKSIAGIEKQPRGLRGLANYADEVQTVLQKEFDGKEATIQIEAIIGTKLKEVESAEEFLIGLNKEMLLILATAKSKQEILYRVTHSAPPRRKPYFVQFPDAEPVSLESLLKANHAESASLPPFKDE